MKLYTSDLDIIFNASNTDTSNIASLFLLIAGMPVRITHNISVELGIANGFDGVLVGMEFSSSNNFQETSFFRRRLPTLEGASNEHLCPFRYLQKK